jgi:hypothetical protein
MKEKNQRMSIELTEDQGAVFHFEGSPEQLLSMIGASVWAGSKKMGLPWEEILRYLEEEFLPRFDADMKEHERTVS